MFRKILIANRGEIALRILRACRDLHIPAVVAYSDADRDSLPVRLADEAVCIGPAQAARSYNNIPAVISAALVTGCDAVHPGYGFLAENATLAEVCQQVGLTFIGPRSDVIERMGNKAEARRVMRSAGVPLLPGSEGVISSISEAREYAREIGFPVVVKAVAGGGGRGMRVVHHDAELTRGFPMAQAEAEAAFGNGAVYIERYLQRPRHVEVQVLGDTFGNVVALGERDCSLQRRHQKVVEEAPAPNLNRKVRDNLLKVAVKGAKAAGYTSAGTLEFLLDTDGRFYFMEMNTRIQVEHPVTEEVTRVDLLAWQIRVAAGERITLSDDALKLRGHSIECRITAEDATNDFQPAVGTVEMFVAPGGPGIRVDTHLFSGYTIPSHYDSLLGKVITWGKDRDEALDRMERALRETVITGVTHTIPFHREIVADEAFRRGDVHTGFIPAFMDRIGTRLQDAKDDEDAPRALPGEGEKVMQMPDGSQQTRQPRGASAEIIAPGGGCEVRGMVRIAPAVLIELIEGTVQGMDGVAGLRSRNKRHRADSDPPIGKSYDNGKVLVTVDGDQIATDITLAVHRGVNVTELSASIQGAIGAMVGKMLGMTVQTVNIYIEEIVSAVDAS